VLYSLCYEFRSKESIALLAPKGKWQSLLKCCHLPHSFVEKILWGDGRTKMGGKAVYESKKSGHFVPVMLQALAFSPAERPIVEKRSEAKAFFPQLPQDTKNPPLAKQIKQGHDGTTRPRSPNGLSRFWRWHIFASCASIFEVVYSQCYGIP
jgi:hypothetical protein